MSKTNIFFSILIAILALFAIVLSLMITQGLHNYYHRSTDSGPGASPVSPPHVQDSPAYSLGDLLDAIEWVESKGNENAIGDNGNAVGSFQIWKIYVDDCNRILSEQRYTYSDRQNKKRSREMVRIYLTYYGGTFEEMARKHVAGPDGWRNDPHWFVRNREYTLEQAERKIANAKAYWLDVKARMEAK